MIKIEKITITEAIDVADEKARMNLKKLIADILKIEMVNVVMRFEDKTGVPAEFNNGL